MKTNAFIRSCLCSFALWSAVPVWGAPQPVLVVVISIDQFRADYLERFREHFGPGGFNLLLEQGAYFTDCHYRHSNTKTGPGHAVMLTGVHANVHGIIANDWLDRQTFEKTSCVGDAASPVVGLPPPTAAPRPTGIDDPYMPRSPKNLLVSTVGDELKMARGGRPKVIGISDKDRGAILMAGKLADAAYFSEYGRMVTSDYYMKVLPAWVQAWNDAGKVDAYFGRKWDRVLPEAAYAVQGPDDAPGEDQTGNKFGNTLPKDISGGATAPGPVFYAAFENTPFSDEVIAEFAKAAIEHEQLGARPGITDLLCLSFSANDRIGHAYGPDSHEIMDNVVRLDRMLAGLFQYLDSRLGLKNCTIVLTADHGVSPMPETIQRLNLGLPAARAYNAEVNAAAGAALDRAFGPLADKSAWFVRDDTWFLFYPSALVEKKITSAAAQAVVRDALRGVPSVQAAYTREQLEAGAVHDELGRRALLSFNRERSGDVFFQTKPYFYSKTFGTTHGAPYNYDTHVPLLWYGAGVPVGVRNDRVGVDDLAPTLARLLGLSAPPQADGRILF
jgi:predicted AlkP superfamily pyrophosphatase or phosphodiesterase